MTREVLLIGGPLNGRKSFVKDEQNILYWEVKEKTNKMRINNGTTGFCKVLMYVRKDDISQEFIFAK